MNHSFAGSWFPAKVFEIDVMRYTQEDLVRRARLILGYDHPRTDYVVEESDGFDVNKVLGERIFEWYGGYLRNSALCILRQEDVASECVVSKAAGQSGGVFVAVPENVVRVCGVCFEHWHCVAEIIGPEHFEEVVRRQLNPYCRATADTPVAVCCVDGTIMCWPDGGDNDSVLTKLNVVSDHSPDYYDLSGDGLEMLMGYLSRC